MAGVKFKVVTPAVPTGTAAKTILLITAAANHRVLIKGFNIAFQGVTNTDAPILVRLAHYSDDGTDGVTNTPIKVNTSDSESIEATALQGPSGTWTVEPTISETFWRTYIHPQQSHREWFPFGEEIVVPGGESFGIAVTAGVSVNCVACLDAEE